MAISIWHVIGAHWALSLQGEWQTCRLRTRIVWLSEMYCPMTQHLLVGQGILIYEVSRSKSHSPHSVGLLWTSDRPDAVTSTWQHKTIARDGHLCPPPQRDSNPQSQLASDRIPTSLTARTTIYIYIYIYATFKIKKKNLSYCSAPFLYLPHFWCCVDIPSEYLSQ